MTRRSFVAAFLPFTLARERTEGFVLSGHLTNAGQEGERYYAIAQGVAVMIDARVWPQAVAGADKLLGGEVELALTRRVG